ncbi:uncharacterized protein LOC110023459 isoform X1 [Phalaenopsis equestris]|uniref:uncharacterized protein LOC110023459 isoform X1 n=1 Tax=Phalaenopsis equestris TaxID=78828 RepID=UPI0009E202A7|nr:uncharacterized protein LOC110023459 isoform X1 [Phalaenopsis equestris]XP_020578552.1 uncharacterized protein LOC110023459 isoform X1 [Phalaenopsis equestris]XP_020578553.1 uncharacterized protein LOC110023459 isoform X1 [Phalaenopsis equestris]
MSSGEIRKVSRQDIKLVQNLIERCLQLYMNQKEVVDTLLYQAKIEPGFTELVWQKLEEENRDFFKAYHVRLMLKNQIMVFNKLLEKQVELMNKVCSSGVGSAPLSHGSCSSTLSPNPSCYLSENASTSRPDGLLSNGVSTSAIIGSGPAGNQNVQLGNGQSTFNGRLDVPAGMLSSKSSLMGRDHIMNGTTIKSEPSYATNSEFAFTGSSFLETQPTLDTLGASYSGTELTAQALNEPLQDIDSSPYGFLSHIPRNFSFSDLTVGFAQSAGILESYDRSPYLAPEANNFTGSPGVDCNEEERRLDTISEGVSYEEFGSE